MFIDLIVEGVSDEGASEGVEEYFGADLINKIGDIGIFEFRPQGQIDVEGNDKEKQFDDIANDK